MISSAPTIPNYDPWQPNANGCLTTIVHDPWQTRSTCPTACQCPNCGDYHITGTSEGPMEWIHLPQVAPPEQRVKRFWAHYDAVGASREMSRGPLPEPIVQKLYLAKPSPRRVHEMRCMTRRPRLSLLERVRKMRG